MSDTTDDMEFYSGFIDDEDDECRNCTQCEKEVAHLRKQITSKDDLLRSCLAWFEGRGLPSNKILLQKQITENLKTKYNPSLLKKDEGKESHE